MRAVVYDRYGPPESLRVEEVPTPSPTTNQVLLRVLATSVNPGISRTVARSPLTCSDGADSLHLSGDALVEGTAAMLAGQRGLSILGSVVDIYVNERG
jgi:hypothetical protein